MADALTTLFNAVKSGSPPPFDWVVEHASDGDVDGAIQRLWVRCKDPRTLEAMSRRLDRHDLATGLIALGRHLAKMIGRGAVGGYAYVEAIAAERASWRPMTWDEYSDHEDGYQAEADRALSKIPTAGIDADDRVKEMWRSFRTYCGALMRRVLAPSWGTRPWEVNEAVNVLTACRTFGRSYVDPTITLAAEHDVARVLRHAWPAPTLAQLMRTR